jgi:non-specific serine/threonine protein kinase
MAYGQGELAQAAALFRRAVEESRQSAERLTLSRALLYLSFSLRDQGEEVASDEVLDEGMSVARECADTWTIAYGLYLQSSLALLANNDELAVELSREAARMFREIGDRFGLSYCLHTVSGVRQADGADDLANATALLEEALMLSRELGNRRGVCFSLGGLAVVAHARGETDRVRQLEQEELRIWYELGNTHRAALVLGALAGAESESGEDERAAQLLGAAEALRASVGGVISGAQKTLRSNEQVLLISRPRLGVARFDKARQRGAEMTLREAAELASRSPAQRDPRPNRPGGLTVRELEIVRLVGEGFSNPGIADRLVIAPRTAETHVGNILNKLKLHSRAQLAAWAVSQGLVHVPADQRAT